MNIEKLTGRLDGVKPTGEGRFLAKCPSHKDRLASLSIRVVEDRILIHCFAGCGAADVMHSVGLTLADLYPERIKHKGDPVRAKHYQARDAVLKTLGPEVSLIALAAANVRKGIPLGAEDLTRLEQAENLLRRALELC